MFGSISIVSIIRLKALYDNVKGPAEQQPGRFVSIVLRETYTDACANIVSGVDIALWSALEINIAIICGSVPALKAFVSQVILRRMDTQPTGSGYGYGYSSAARKQSRVLGSVNGDDEYKMDRLEIVVRNSFEMNRGDDGGSESDLIIQNNAYSGLSAPSKVHISSTTGTKRQSTGV